MSSLIVYFIEYRSGNYHDFVVYRIIDEDKAKPSDFVKVLDELNEMEKSSEISDWWGEDFPSKDLEKVEKAADAYCSMLRDDESKSYVHQYILETYFA